MTRTLRRSSLAVLAALIAVVATAAIAWACTPQAYLYLGATSVTPSSAGGGGPVTVTGRGFTSGPVQIRLDSGRLLATAQGPNFSLVVRIKNVAPGVHYVHGIAYSSNGAVAGDASRPLVVKAAAPARHSARILPPPAPGRPSRPATRATRTRPAHGSARPSARPAHQRVRSADRSSARPAPAPVAQPPRTIAAAPPVLAKPRHRVSRPAVTPVAEPAALPAGNPWIVRAPAAATVSDKADEGVSGLVIALAAGLLALGLAGIGGAGVALARTRTRSPAPTLVADALPAPVAEPQTSSLDAELQTLLAEHYAREESGAAARDEVAPREGVDSPH